MVNFADDEHSATSRGDESAPPRSAPSGGPTPSGPAARDLFPRRRAERDSPSRRTWDAVSSTAGAADGTVPGTVPVGGDLGGSLRDKLRSGATLLEERRRKEQEDAGRTGRQLQGLGRIFFLRGLVGECHGSRERILFLELSALHSATDQEFPAYTVAVFVVPPQINQRSLNYINYPR